MTNPNVPELVCADIHHKVRTGTIALGYHTGGEALLDIYDSLIELTCHVRAVIQDMTIGSGRGIAEEPHHRAARQRDDDEVPPYA